MRIIRTETCVLGGKIKREQHLLKIAGLMFNKQLKNQNDEGT